MEFSGKSNVAETFAIFRDVLDQSLPSKFHETAESHWPLFPKAPRFLSRRKQIPDFARGSLPFDSPFYFTTRDFRKGSFEQFYTELVVIFAKNYSPCWLFYFQGIAANFIPANSFST